MERDREMGMDVVGVNPKNGKGEYFRNNWWWWRPLWEFCEFVAPELAGKVEHAGSNDGDGLDGDDAEELGKALRKAVKNGTAKSYKAEREAWLASLPIRPCAHCQATGKRTWFTSPDGKEQVASIKYDLMEVMANEADNDGVGNGQLPHYQPVEKPEGWTEKTEDCNGCQGTGGQQHWAKEYPFDEKNVAEFATFLVNCGGFQLW